MRLRSEETDLPPADDRRRLRKAAGLSTHVVAARIGVSPSSIHAWEAGAREPTGLQLRAYRKALTELAEFVGEEAGVSWPNDS